MPVRLKPLARQVVLITGASSGIGLATARMAASRGAAVMLVARDEPSLSEAAQAIRDLGGRAAFHVADVADIAALQAAAVRAEHEFGALDSWVNDAGTSVVGTLEETPIDDQRRLFDTNYWGTVNGSLVAAKRLRQRGGAIVNVGSVLSDRALIYQGTYSATKHAVKAFTDTLRMELEAEGAPISVTLIKPSSIDTPFQEHARLTWELPGVRVPPPVYDPQLVARAICFACANPRRDLVVGGGGAVIALAGALFPRLTDFAMEAVGKPGQAASPEGLPERRDNLRRGRPGGDARSSLGRAARRTSLLLEAQLHPLATLATLAGAGAMAIGMLAARRR
ncbi:SDR family oxidoreductase [Falsiroseomonas sp. HW251]|uniref:SDR family oxidoreductase n=1 Tax=Falsiroseomonas sp. HW251 TaxID=3390998 RepID=UPI003D31C3C7